MQEVTVLDVRGHVDTVQVEPGVEKSTYVADYDSYLEAHIPGAVFFDWTRDAIDMEAASAVQMQMQPDVLAAALEAKGVSHEKPVVAYDAGDGMMAARLWWVLSVAGHPCPLVLEGGWTKWQAEGRPSELHEPCTLKVYSYFDAELRPELRATLQDVEGLLAACNQSSSTKQRPLMLDVRSQQQYTAQVRRGPRGGHIPGAVSLPRSVLLDPASGWFKPLEQQRQLLEQAGVVLSTPDQPRGQHQEATGVSRDDTWDNSNCQKVVIYCNGGVAACTAALALHRLGHNNWCVYDGSWNEYSCTNLPAAAPSV
eukprot:gene6530-6758_t